MTVNNANLDFSTAFRYEHIAVKGNIAFSVPAFGFVTNTIPHNLGYNPYVKSFYTFGDGKYFQLFTGTVSFNVDGNNMQIDDAFTDTVNYYVNLLNNAAGTVTGTIYYRIYAEPQV